MELIPKQLGHFQIRGHIGRSDACLIYLAIDTRDNQEVFLTVLDPRAPHDPNFLQRFVQQGQAAIKLQHPNLAQVREAGIIEQYHYVASQAIPGVTLASVLRQRNSPMPPDETADIINQVAAALDYAHDHGFLHQNLSPHDIWLTREGVALVTGVGLARRSTVNVAASADYEAETIVSPIHVTPFLAPEQARGETEIDRRADVYSLGAIAYAMLVGRPPFDASDQFLLLNEVIHGTPSAPEAVTPNVPAGMAFVLKFVLSKEANLRYAKASEFATALNQGKMWRASAVGASNGLTGLLTGNASVEASRQWWRRLAGVAVLLVLILGIGAVATGAIYQLDFIGGIVASGEAAEATPAPGVAIALATEPPDLSTPTPDTFLGVTLSNGQILDTAGTPTAEDTPTLVAADITPTSVVGVTNTGNITPAITPSTDVLSPTLVLTEDIGNGSENTATVITPTAEVALVITPTATLLPAPTATATPVPTDPPTSTPTSTSTSTPTSLPTPTNPVAPTATATPAPTLTPTAVIQVAAVTPTEPPILIPTDTPTTAATATSIPTVPPTATATATPTNTPTATVTDTPAPTATHTVAPTNTSTVTETPTALPTATHTPEPTATATPLPTDTPTAIATNTPEPTNTPMATATPLPTAIPTATATNTPLPTAIPTATATNTPLPTAIPTATATNTSLPSATPTATPLPTNTPTATATYTSEPTNTPTATYTSSPTATPTHTATSTSRPTATSTSTRRPTATPTKTPIPLPTPTNTPVDTPTPAPTATATATPTLAPTPTVIPLLVGRVTLVQGANNGWVARITGQVEPGSTVQALVDNQPANAVRARANGTWTINVPLADPGEHEVSVVAELPNGGRLEADTPAALLVVPTPAPPPPPAGNVQLVEPGDNAGGGGDRRFSWQADFAPGEGQGFELVFWRPGQDPMANGFGLAAPTTGNSVSVDLDALDEQLGPTLDPGEYQWGVLLVQNSPYQRLRFLGDSNKFNFARGGDSDSSGGGSGGGSSSGE